VPAGAGHRKSREMTCLARKARERANADSSGLRL
jgi:hypothetical protein